MKNKFIVLYGINNIGKSTQVEKLVARLGSVRDDCAVSIKYPFYKREPLVQF